MKVALNFIYVFTLSILLVIQIFSLASSIRGEE